MKTCRQLFQSSLNHVNMPQCQNIGTKGFEFLPWHLELRISFVLMHLHAFVWQALLQATGNSGGKPGEKLWWSRLSHLHISCWSFHAWCLSPMLRPMFKDQHIEKLLNRNISEIGATLHQFSHNLPIWLYVQNCEGSCQINIFQGGLLPHVVQCNQPRHLGLLLSKISYFWMQHLASRKFSCWKRSCASPPSPGWSSCPNLLMLPSWSL